MTDAAIRAVHGRRVWDSRGWPTVEVTVELHSGARARAIAPAGASRGRCEAVELRDGGRLLGGRDVRKAIRNVNERIAPALAGLEGTDQEAVDAALIALDGTPLKSNLGGNAIVATSLAVLHAAAAHLGLPLWQHIAQRYQHPATIPLPEIQIFGGGAHADHRIDVQDFMIMVPGAASFEEALEVTAEVYAAAGSLMRQKGHSLGVADEGGWWPAFTSNEEAIETLLEAIETAGETPGDRVVISLDIAASELGKEGRYHLAAEERSLSSDQMIEMLCRWLTRYPIVSVEDPLAEDDPSGMQAFTREHGGRVQIVGDDCLVTDARLIEAAAADGACNAVLLKVNQAGTVSEAVAAAEAAMRSGYRRIVSARSGETEDLSVSHLAVGLNAGQLKVGSFSRSERMAKWNECLRIQDELPKEAFVGAAPLSATWWAAAKADAGIRTEAEL